MAARKNSKSNNDKSNQFIHKFMDDKRPLLSSGNRIVPFERTSGREMVDVVSRLIMHFEKGS